MEADPVILDSDGRRQIYILGAVEPVVIDAGVWKRLHARNPRLTDRQLYELHHDDFAHGTLAAMKARPAEQPVTVTLADMRMRPDAAGENR